MIPQRLRDVDAVTGEPRMRGDDPQSDLEFLEKIW